MKKTIFVIILLLISTQAFAGNAPDVRIGAYDRVITSQDVIASGVTPIRLSANKSVPTMAVYLCANPANTVGVTWGDSSINSLNGPGVRLVGSPRSCDTIYVDNLQDIWVSSDAGQATVDYNYFV